MTMSATSPVCLQLLPSWCTAANDEESDKQQRLSSLFLRSHTSWPAKSNRSSRGDANSSSCGGRGGDVNFRSEVEARAGYSSGSLTTAGSRSSSGSASPSSSSASSSSSRGGIVLPMMVTTLQSSNQVETFSGMRAVNSAPVGRRDVHGRMLAREPGIGKASALLPVTMPTHRAQNLHKWKGRPQTHSPSKDSDRER